MTPRERRLTFYSFRSVWSVSAPPEQAFATLRELELYPKWWPEVRETRRLDDKRFEVLCRSFLPYDLRFVTQQERIDEAAGVLEASMTGDLEGFSRWTITGTPDVSLLTFEEEVVTNKKLLNALAPLARVAFKANHTLMMRNGERGLRTFLAGARFRETTGTGPAPG